MCTEYAEQVKHQPARQRSGRYLYKYWESKWIQTEGEKMEKNNVAKMSFSDFEVFDNYMKECAWEHHLHEAEKALDVRMSELIFEHLDMMQENLIF